MPITVLKIIAIEKSTYGIVIAFTDEEGNAVTPNAGTCLWTLTDIIGTVINTRFNQAIASANPLTIVLKDNDLLIQASENVNLVQRRLNLYCEYDSDLGTNLPFRDSCEFPLRDLVGS